MKITEASAGNATILRLSGRLDASNSMALEAAVLPAIGGAGQRLLLDMTDVQYISSAGLRVMLMAAKQARATGGGFAVFGMNNAVRTMFETPGFLRIIAAFASEDEALADAGGRA